MQFFHNLVHVNPSWLVRKIYNLIFRWNSSDMCVAHACLFLAGNLGRRTGVAVHPNSFSSGKCLIDQVMELFPELCEQFAFIVGI
jgi:hypothetical protein